MIQKATLENGKVVNIQTSGAFEFLKSDWMKALIMAVLAAVFASIYELIQNGTLFKEGSLETIGLAAIGGFVTYITKNFVMPTSKVIQVTPYDGPR